jgi:hypothetical protein
MCDQSTVWCSDFVLDKLLKIFYNWNMKNFDENVLTHLHQNQKPEELWKRKLCKWLILLCVIHKNYSRL